MYTDIIRLASLSGSPIKFILGGWHQDDNPTCGAQTVAMATPVA